jgi:hypothetical protein
LQFLKENRQVAAAHHIGFLPRSKNKLAEPSFFVEMRFGGEGRISFLESQQIEV